ncbi:MAG: dihydroorotase [Lentisphaeria bacterium]|nr:dihydroorotase [Lentisphaeria bacterium]
MQITIPSIDDFHIHLRNDARMPIATQELRNGGVSRGLIMPNIMPKPVKTAAEFEAYRTRLQAIEPNFSYYGSITLSPKTTEQEVIDAVNSDVLIGKQYPAGVTTNSENGVTDISTMYPIYEYMEEHGLPLSFHGELPKVSLLEAEKAFLPIIPQLAKRFPKLRIILEHISTADAVKTILDAPDHIVAGVTVQHLLLTIQDVIGSRLQPHNFCMPIVKTAADRQAIIDVVKSGNSKFFFGSDSAPHFRNTKECSLGAAGVFTTPMIAPMLAYIFEKNEMLDQLENFTSKFGADFYNLPRNQETITLSNEAGGVVPGEYSSVVPLCAGKKINWKLIK